MKQTIPYSAGDTVGVLTLISFTGSYRGKKWTVRCVCGHEFQTKQSELKSRRSCGCVRGALIAASKRSHGMATYPEYRIYHGIKKRCYSPSEWCYQHYGGRGIKMCQRWLDSFEQFYEDMGRRPSKGHSIDRIDVNGDYSPENCRWATAIEQARNSRHCRMLEYGGESKPMSVWAEELNFHYDTVKKYADRYGDVDAVSMIISKCRRRRRKNQAPSATALNAVEELA